MVLVLVAVGLLVLSGLAALLLGGSSRRASLVGVAGAVMGSGIGLVSAVSSVFRGSSESLRLDWSVPLGSFFVELDALSCFFLVPTFLLSMLAAIYGREYLKSSEERKSSGPHWFFFNLLIAAMVMVFLARNGVLFLMSWEGMALASFFLVAFDHEQETVRDAAWTYLVASHVGTGFLFACFLIFGRESGSLDFDHFSTVSATPVVAGTLFVLALIGFGTKAGLMPLHVWLPDAHPAAPSHVSALMSGVMIKTGIYGIMRVLSMLGTPQAWWGWVLIAVGLLSGCIGILFAMAQHDLKRLLAYSSIENIGIIALGLGVGILGVTGDAPGVAVLGFCGALLHVLNHAVFKGLLFMGAGSVLHGTGTRDMNQLGGLHKRMPWTSVTFLIGAAAISGLPVLNGFMGEFMIYLSAFRGGSALEVATAAPLFAALCGLALIGGLAIACFTKVCGTVLLGEPRTTCAAHAHEPGWSMRLPLISLAALCVLIGVCTPLILSGMSPAIALASGIPNAAVARELEAAGRIQWHVVLGGSSFVALAVLLTLVRRRLLTGRVVELGPTWDCGYALPTARMQYSPSAFTQPLVDQFHAVVRSERSFTAPSGPFPELAEFTSASPDVTREKIYRPLFGRIAWLSTKLRWVQHGRLDFYVLYIVLTLLILLVANLGVSS